MAADQTYADILQEFAALQITVEEVTGLETLFAYQGFDPVRLIRQLQAKHPDWKEDAKSLIVLALTRGTKISKMLGKTSDEGKDRITELKDRYGLVDSAKTRDDITTARVAAALPTWTIRAANMIGTGLPLGPARFEEITGLPISGYMCCPAFAACIPSAGVPNVVSEQLRQAFYLWQYHFTRLINPEAKNQDKQTISQGFRQAVDAAVNSTPFSNPARIQLLMGVGLLGQRAGVHFAPQGVADLAEKWRTLR